MKILTNYRLHFHEVECTPPALFNFEILQYGAYWRAEFKRGRWLFQSKKSYSFELLNFCHYLFPNNNK